MTIKIKVGTAGVDTLIGTAGTDALFGLAGNDILRGGGGADYLSGGLGDDILEGGAGSDTLHGGAGNDTFQYKIATDANGDKIQSFAVGDRIDFSALTAHHFIGNQQFNGVAGEIRYTDDPNNLTNLPIDINYPYPTGIEIDANGDGEADATIFIKNTVNLVETALNSGVLIVAANQIKTGTAAGETLTGGSGNDRLLGLGGNDYLVGGEGRDHLFGGDGNDTLDGGFGRDIFNGGAGNDIFRFTEPDGMHADVITDFSVGDQLFMNIQDFQFWGDYIGDAEFSGETGQYRLVQTPSFSLSGNYATLEFDFNGDYQEDASIQLSNFTKMLQETAAGSNRLIIATDQVFTGTGLADTKTTGNGNDMLNGLAGNDTLNGGMGNDTVNGGDGNDTLTGWTGDDTLSGGNGNDTLIGGQGSDTLIGGAGNDIFKFLALNEVQSPSQNFFYNGQDSINDFAGLDKIDLSGIDAVINENGNQAFTYIGNNQFTGVEGQLRFDNGFSGAGLYGDINGDLQADFSISLNGILSAPLAANLIL
ncbi:MAG: hypothetical protein PHH59_02105 [Methylovulum sp.]|uniref:calcium-binding protein n=1 Tax=Methylovulum sp. TaxID=1916980 RepID=UPI00261C31BF|nr:hypothetical protein [Methylovulum sp.]MDD2722803.1 hypothetical protein [Methylovulum sp.]MDD5124905.1 hypothetical protein [Methylovulum sp.]